MYLSNLHVEGFMRVRVVDVSVKAEPGVVEFTGKNRQGKSSTIDAIWYAIEPKAAKKKIVDAVNDEAETGKIILTFDNGMVIERNLKKDGKDTLKLTMADGSRDSKEGTLQKFFGPSFDPKALMEMEADQQAKYVLQSLGLEHDLKKLDAEYRTIELERRDIGRDRDQAKARIPAVPPKKRQLKSVDDLKVERSAIAEHQRRYEDVHKLVVAARQDVLQINEEIKDLKRRLEEAETRKTRFIEDGVKAKQEMDNIGKPDLGRLEQIQSEIDDAAAIAQEVAAYQAYADNKTIYTQKSMAYDNMTQKLTAIKSKKKELLTNADFPLEGMEFRDGMLYLDGHPLKQARDSSQEFLACFAIAVASLPPDGFRFIRMRGGESLDDSTREVVRQMCEKYKVQLFLETMDQSGEVGIVIEDGTVKSNNYVGK